MIQTYATDAFRCGHPRTAANTAPAGDDTRCRTCWRAYKRHYERHVRAEARAYRALAAAWAKVQYDQAKAAL